MDSRGHELGCGLRKSDPVARSATLRIGSAAEALMSCAALRCDDSFGCASVQLFSASQKPTSCCLRLRSFVRSERPLMNTSIYTDTDTDANDQIESD